MAATLSRCSRARLPPAARLRALPALLHPLPHRRISTGAAAATLAADDGDLLHAPPPAAAPRVDRLKHARPFSEFLTDGFGRQHTYLRISVTERCNLRCLYCMPEEGVPLSPPTHLLSTPEILEIARLFVSQGVTKIRLTGGEPTVRKDIVELVEELGKLRSMGLKEVCMTSNGIALNRKLPRMVEAGLTGLNLSLDTLDPVKFQLMTRRKGLDQVLKTIETALSFPTLQTKLNAVVMAGLNDAELPSFVDLTRDSPLEVRFIEYMPFDGNKWNKSKMLPYAAMVSQIHQTHPTLQQLATQRPNDTSKTWHVPGYKGTVGFITSMTHNFCGSCNRLRITGDGNLKVCLFGDAEVSLRDMMRRFRERDAAVGEGREGMEEEMLEVVGRAVGRKKERHAGMGELENMKNRPMILIDRAASLQRGFPFSASPPTTTFLRLYSTKPPSEPSSPKQTLPHLTPTGEAHMVTITPKPHTARTATALGRITFSNPLPLTLIRRNAIKKGDVLSLARIAGIMAAKRCPDLVPLCHPILLTGVSVEVEVGGEEGENGWVDVKATVECVGQTGVEMEALTAVVGAGLTVVDMCKAVDRRMVLGECRVVHKAGGRSGEFVE